jgi:hypothetical protein
MLGVEEHPSTLRAEERDRVPHHRDALVQIRPQGFGDVEIPRLPDDADDLGAGVEQLPQHGAVLCPLAGLARHAERRQRGVMQRLLRRELEELGVARAGARPAALDVGHAQLVDLVQDAQPVLDRV